MKKFEDFPLWQKAYEILKIVDVICQSCKDEVRDNPVLRNNLEFMQEDAAQIPAKIAGAFHVSQYDIRMENATIIRKCAKSVHLLAGSLSRAGLGNKDYTELLRDTIENEFRPMFAEWVATFDREDYIIDRWGLFNPPGVNYDDHDPDDDIPFDAASYLEEMGFGFDEDEEDDEFFGDPSKDDDSEN